MASAVLVVCAAPLTRRVGDLVDSMESSGWATSVVGTPASVSWLGSDLSTTLAVRFDYRTADQPTNTEPPDAVVVCPATFNTVNKIAAGIADNFATSLICEAIGAGTPVLITPMVNRKLWGHFRWSTSLEVLSESGIRFLNPSTGGEDLYPVESGTGDLVTGNFQPEWLIGALHEMLLAR